MRGLGQLVRSKNIRTVGDLSKLTEYEINHLPIRSPKVATVLQVLDNFAAKLKIEDKDQKETQGEELYILMSLICMLFYPWASMLWFIMVWDQLHIMLIIMHIL